MSEDAARRLFRAKVASQWDWSQSRRGVLDELLQAVLDVLAGRADEASLYATAQRLAGSPVAAQQLAGQMMAVVREAREG